MTSARKLPAADRRRLLAVLKALADPTRLEIFRMIAGAAAPVCVCEVTARFDVSQPTISHHLKVLLGAGLVTVSRRGVWAYYAPDVRGVSRARDSIAALFPEGAPAEA